MAIDRFPVKNRKKNTSCKRYARGENDRDSTVKVTAGGRCYYGKTGNVILLILSANTTFRVFFGAEYRV